MAKRQVRLLVGRTGFGRAGDVVDYPVEDYDSHLDRGLIAAIEPTAKAKAEPAPAEQTPTEDAPAETRRSRK